MCFLLNENSQNKPFATFLDLCCFFFSQYPQKTCYGDQNHHQQAIYLSVSNFLMIYLPKNNNENLSLSRWYLAPILPGLLYFWLSLWNFNYWWFSIRKNKCIIEFNKTDIDIDKTYLYVKDLLYSKYQLLINGRGRVRIKNLKNPKSFIDNSQTVDDVYENLEDYNPKKKRRFWCLIANKKSNKN